MRLILARTKNPTLNKDHISELEVPGHLEYEIIQLIRDELKADSWADGIRKYKFKELKEG